MNFIFIADNLWLWILLFAIFCIIGGIGQFRKEAYIGDDNINNTIYSSSMFLAGIAKYMIVLSIIVKLILFTKTL